LIAVLFFTTLHSTEKKYFNKINSVLTFKDKIITATNGGVFISTDYHRSTNNLNIECIINGRVEIQMIDLMGNMIMSKAIEKKSFSITVPLGNDYPSGTYLLRIRINNDLLYYNKINIVK
jgi:hypothetical protein